MPIATDFMNYLPKDGDICIPSKAYAVIDKDYRYIYAMFSNIEEAETYRCNNDDFETVQLNFERQVNTDNFKIIVKAI